MTVPIQNERARQVHDRIRNGGLRSRCGIDAVQTTKRIGDDDLTVLINLYPEGILDQAPGRDDRLESVCGIDTDDRIRTLIADDDVTWLKADGGELTWVSLLDGQGARPPAGASVATFGCLPPGGVLRRRLLGWSSQEQDAERTPPGCSR
jgi:hypothetical protein